MPRKMACVREKKKRKHEEKDIKERALREKIYIEKKNKQENPV